MTDVDMSKSALDEFETLLSESFGDEVSIEGSVVKGPSYQLKVTAHSLT